MSGVVTTGLDPYSRRSLRSTAGLEQGSFSAFLVISMTGFSVVISALFSALLLAQKHAELVVAVDLAALAAADTHRGLVSGIVCENAESILKTVDALLTTCRIVGDGVMVTGQLSLPLMVLMASAVAGEI